MGPRRTLVDQANKLKTDTTYHGPVFLLSHLAGRYPSVILLANSPVEDGVTCAWHTLLVKSPPHAVVTADDVGSARVFQEASRLVLAQDFEVWAHQAPALNILQVNCDGPFHLERIWYRQFFNRRARRSSRSVSTACIGARVRSCATTRSSTSEAAPEVPGRSIRARTRPSQR